jgi:hypothetical protein
VTLELINNFAAADLVILNAFCAQYYMGLVQDIFFVLTDTDHKSGESRMIGNSHISPNISSAPNRLQDASKRLITDVPASREGYHYHTIIRPHSGYRSRNDE